MKLLSLRLQGFMPYRDAQSIDFSDKTIFALVGPTGSGKSAILDAITFAFFGKVARWENQSPGNNLISQGAEKLHVEVDFKIKDATYRISRLVKRKGSKQEAQLTQLVAGQFKQLNKERMKQKDINAELVELLKMDYATFTRTLMLPQGQFDRLLKPKEPKERKELLIQLAGLKIYDQLKLRLDQRLQPIQEKLSQLQGQLENFQGLEPTQVAQLEQEQLTVQQQQQDNQVHLQQASQSLQQIRHDLQSLAQLRECKAELDILLKQANYIEDLRQRLQQSQQLDKQSGHLQHLDQLRQDTQELKNFIDQEQKRRDDFEVELHIANQALEEARSMEQQIPRLEQERSHMLELKEQILSYEKLRQDMTSTEPYQLERQLEQLQELLDNLRHKNQQGQSKIATLQQALTMLSQSQPVTYWQSAIDLYQRLQSSHKANHDNRAAYLKNQSDLELWKKQQSEAQKRELELLQQEQNYRAQLEHLKQGLSAQILRQDLEIGCPCPVCLQKVVNLPELTLLKAEQLEQFEQQCQDSQQELKVMQKQLQEIQHNLSVTGGQRPLLEQNFQQSQLLCHELESEFQQRFGLDLNLSQLQEKLKEAEDHARQQQDLTSQLEVLTKEQQESETQIKVQENTYESKQILWRQQLEKFQALARQVTQAQTRLQEQLGDTDQFIPEVQRRIKKLEDDKDNIQNQLYQCSLKQQKQQQDFDQSVNKLSIAQEQYQSKQILIIPLEKRLQDLLQELRLDDEIALRDMILPPEDTVKFKQQIEVHCQRQHRLEEQQHNLLQQLQDRRPQPEELLQAQTREQEYSQLQTRLDQHQGALQEQLRQLQVNLQQAERVRTQEQEVQYQLKLHKKLASMVTASGLKAFVANNLLKEILRLASDELERLSGRYQLQLDKDGDILVLDNWNAGESRDIRSLSGGETFLASLSLALAMVEYLAQGSPLESLFIDEGFGTLDQETLEAVTLTLEALHANGRLVGIITHVAELAERLPVQIRVEKDQGRSRILE